MTSISFKPAITFRGTQTIQDILFKRVEDEQVKIDASFNPQTLGPMPNDAIAVNRVANIRALCAFIEEICQKKPDLTLGDIVTKALQPAKDQVIANFPFTGEALDLIINAFGTSSIKGNSV